MQPNDEHDGPIAIRPAQRADVVAILELLTEYDLPYSYFAPFYEHDASYEPGQSWIVVQQEQILAHLRIFDRWLRIGPVQLHIAGIGNVITARRARGQGYAGQMMRAALQALAQQDYAYSLLWTHIPDMYVRYGWMPITQESIHATLVAPGPSSLTITPFQPSDLTEVMDLYASVHAQRTGTTARTPAYWHGQLEWLGERAAPEHFLVARTADGALAGYIRTTVGVGHGEINELTLASDDHAIGRTLLAQAAARHDGHLQAILPPSLWSLFAPTEAQVVDTPGLMGRVINTGRLVPTMEALWQTRFAAAGAPDGLILLAPGAGYITLRAHAGTLQIITGNGEEAAYAIQEEMLAHLLWRGYDDSARDMIEDGPSLALIAALFPAQDSILWPADAY